MLTSLPENTGEFQNELNNWFTYRPNSNKWGLQHGLTVEIDVLDGTRCAKLLKTVVYVAVDENDDGSPILEKWAIKKHNHYTR
jgi:hypothetical protein